MMDESSIDMKSYKNQSKQWVNQSDWQGTNPALRSELVA